MITRNEWTIALKVEFWRKFNIRYDDVGYDSNAFNEMYDDGLSPSEAVEEEYYAACMSM